MSQIALLMLLLLTSVVAPRTVQARQEVTATADTLAPINDILSASSWLVASGLDPRFPAVPTTSAANLEWSVLPVTSTSDPSATPAAATTQIVTGQVGSFPFTSQPSLAVNPIDPNHLVLGVSALDLPSVATYVSHDGGQTWSGPFQAPYFQGDLAAVGGPALAFDRAGNLILASLSVGLEEIAVGRQRVSNLRSRISVSRSADGGMTWNDPISAAVSAAGTALAADELGGTRGEVTTRFLDKPSLIIGADPRRPDREVVYVAYTELSTRFSAADAPGEAILSFPRVSSTIQLIRSSDGGATWSSPRPVSPTAARSISSLGPSNGPPLPSDLPVQEPVPPAAGSPAAGDQVVQGAQAAMLSDGSLVVAYLDSTRDGPHAGLARVMVALSSDGGQTFAEPVSAGVFREIATRPRTAFFRWWSASFPRIAIGQEGEIFIAVTAKPGDRPADGGDVILLRSLDGGATWEAPAAIAAEPSTASQFFPALATQPDGTLTAIWADMRDDPSQIAYQIYAAQSSDRGATWDLSDETGQQSPASRISSAPSNSLLGFPTGQFLGDQLAIATPGDAFAVAWPDTRLAGPNGPNQQIAFSRP